MKYRRGSIGLLLFLLPLSMLVTESASADAGSITDQVGDTFLISIESVTETTGSRSSGNSNSRAALVERVLAIRDDGIELEFDLPENTSPEARFRNWQYPARVFKPSSGSFELLNESEIKSRLNAWLERFPQLKPFCGRWVFTWTAQRIECDPLSVVKKLEPFDLRHANIQAGADFEVPMAVGPRPLKSNATDSDRTGLIVELELDPKAVRTERAMADIAVAEISGQATLSLDEAMEARESERISGSIIVSFELGERGEVLKRVTTTETEILGADGLSESATKTLTTVRKRLD